MFFLKKANKVTLNLLSWENNELKTHTSPDFPFHKPKNPEKM